MATSDLLAELSKDSFRAAPDVEKKVVAACCASWTTRAATSARWR